MSRDDAPEVVRLSLGECDCPRAIHDSQSTRAVVSRPTPAGMEWDLDQEVKGDWADVVERSDYGTIRYIAAAYVQDDTGLAQARLIQRSVQAWNLTDGDGDPLHINIPSIDRLGERQSRILVQWTDRPRFQRGLETAEARTAESDPNGSGGSSLNGQGEPLISKESTQPTPTSPTTS